MDIRHIDLERERKRIADLKGPRHCWGMIEDIQDASAKVAEEINRLEKLKVDLLDLQKYANERYKQLLDANYKYYLYVYQDWVYTYNPLKQNKSYRVMVFKIPETDNITEDILRYSKDGNSRYEVVYNEYLLAKDWRYVKGMVDTVSNAFVITAMFKSPYDVSDSVFKVPEKQEV